MGNDAFGAKAPARVKSELTFGAEGAGLVAEGRRGTTGRLTWENIMKAIANLVSQLVRDEQGGEVLEYALIAGLIVVAAITVIGSVGTKVAAKWSSLNSSL